MDASTAAKATPKPSIADRLWDAARTEFSLRGYHGARVQGIARRAGCNVALLYRHWASKKALYLAVLRTLWRERLGTVLQLMERGGGAPAVVGAYLDANLRDPPAAQIIVREILDGGPYLNQLLTDEPELIEPVHRAARALSGDAGGAAPALRPGLDPTLAVLSVGGLAALVASAHDATRPFFPEPVSPDVWRQHLYDLLLHGVVGCSHQPEGGAVGPGPRGSAA